MSEKAFDQKKIKNPNFRIETVNKLEIDRNFLNWPDKGHLKNLQLTSHLVVKDWTAYLLASEIRQGYLYLKHFPGGLEGNAPACNAGDLGSIPGLGRFPRRRKWQPTPVLLPGKSHGWRSMVGYSPWGHRESDTTEQRHVYTNKKKKTTTRMSTTEPIQGYTRISGQGS